MFWVTGPLIVFINIIHEGETAAAREEDTDTEIWQFYVTCLPDCDHHS